MTREINSTVLARLVSNQISGFILVEIDLGEANPRYLTKSPRNITYEGNTYLSDGGLVGIAPTEATSILDDQSMSVSMIDSDGTIQAAVDTNTLNGNNVEILAVLNDSSGQPLIASGQPFSVYKGVINGVNITRNEDTYSYSFQISSPFADFDVVEPRPGSGDYQQRFIPDGQEDTAFDRVHVGLEEVRLGWGKI